MTNSDVLRDRNRFAATDPIFTLLTPAGPLTAFGKRQGVHATNLDQLDKAVRTFFAQSDNMPFVCGALPYDRTRPIELHQPHRTAKAAPSAPPLSPGDADGCHLHAEPSAAEYGRIVAAGLKILEDEQPSPHQVRKVVLARSLALRCDKPVGPFSLVQKLALDPAINAFCALLPQSETGDTPFLVGATPELLVSKHGRSVVSHPMAGTTRRRSDPDEDKAAAESLLKSGKDLREHAMVAEAVCDTLAPFCSELRAPDGPALAATATLWHLGTRITGTLRDPDISSIELAAALHPTPAVCGLPRMEAAKLIAELEPLDRGHYAGAVGWCTADGDGEWYVSLRCAEITGLNMRLFAGAGIVTGSIPEAEIAETGAKFLAMLGALGLSEHHRLLEEVNA